MMKLHMGKEVSKVNVRYRYRESRCVTSIQFEVDKSSNNEETKTKENAKIQSFNIPTGHKIIGFVGNLTQRVNRRHISHLGIVTCPK